MTHGELVSEALKRIDLVGLKRCREVFPESTWTKFFNAGEFLNFAAAHALRFDANLPRGAACLDVGCGFGYTALCLEILGHSCLGWDAPSMVLKNVSLNIPLKKWCLKLIERNELEELLQQYDLIYLHGVWPMRDASGWWSGPDYQMFARKLISALKPGGRLEIIANRGDQIPVCCSSVVWGPLADNSTVHIMENEIHYVRAAEMPAGAD